MIPENRRTAGVHIASSRHPNTTYVLQSHITGDVWYCRSVSSGRIYRMNLARASYSVVGEELASSHPRRYYKRGGAWYCHRARPDVQTILSSWENAGARGLP